MSRTSDLDGALRSLDPAEPAGRTAGARAAADLAAILATGPATPRSEAGRRPHRPRRTARRRVLVAGGAIAALTAGAIALPPLSGGDAAYASWTAQPTGLSEQEQADAAAGCRDRLLDGYEAELRAATPAVAERRGAWTTVVLAGQDGFAALCITDDSGGLFGGGMIGSIGTPLDWVPPGPRELRARDLGRGTTDAGDLSLAAGDAGDDVASVVYRSRTHGAVTATLSQGKFALWLPGDELEDASSRGVEVAVTYRDGSTGTSTLTL